MGAEKLGPVVAGPGRESPADPTGAGVPAGSCSAVVGARSASSLIRFSFMIGLSWPRRLPGPNSVALVQGNAGHAQAVVRNSRVPPVLVGVGRAGDAGV